MTDATTLRGLLATATSLIDDGDLDAAEDVLKALSQDPGRSALGPETVLGEPRRLHAARLRIAKRRGDDLAKIGLQYSLVPPVALLAELFEVSAAERRNRVEAAQKPVPRVLHQVWIGSAPPETTEIWRNHARRHGWDYVLWDETALKSEGIEDDPVFRLRLARGDVPGAVDVARYYILQRRGGLYLDCDWVPLRNVPFEDFLPMAGLSAIAEETPRQTGTGSPFLNNSVLAAPPEHPTFDMLLAQLPEVSKRLPKGPAWWVTGPLVFTLAVRGGPVTVLDAALLGGAYSGTRAQVEAEIAHRVSETSPAFLGSWKPWGDGD